LAAQRFVARARLGACVYQRGAARVVGPLISIGIGLIGEYVGRTYQVVRARQRYHVREMLEMESSSDQKPRQ